ncbi:MAG: hypothetical protein QM619_09475 [Micropruina sp.]|uniref:DUF6912 family protein n=1 Tax=Micropruina sp. TaxID=2737536 RepID=UPI0039E471E9
MLVFVPLTTAELATWAESGRHRPAAAYAVTPSLRAAFGFSLADDEDAEHTALHIAGLDALLRGGRRLVAVAEAAATPVSGAEFGEVAVGVLGFDAVTALFADESPVSAEALADRVGGRALDTAWDDPAVAEFLADNELLWHGPTEWQSLVAGEPRELR